MPDITIRGLDAAVVENLERQASAAGRDLAEEARLIIERAVLPEHAARMARLRAAMAGRAPRHGGTFTDSTGLLRQLRGAWQAGQAGEPAA